MITKLELSFFHSIFFKLNFVLLARQDNLFKLDKQWEDEIFFSASCSLLELDIIRGPKRSPKNNSHLSMLERMNAQDSQDKSQTNDESGNNERKVTRALSAGDYGHIRNF